MLSSSFHLTSVSKLLQNAKVNILWTLKVGPMVGSGVVVAKNNLVKTELKRFTLLLSSKYFDLELCFKVMNRSNTTE